MHIIKRIFKVVSLILFLLIATFVVINLFDADPNPNLYTLADVPPQDFDPSNGYYILWGLSEPESVDVQSEEYTRRFRECMETPEGELFNRKAGDSPMKGYRDKFDPYHKIIKKIELPSRPFEEDWFDVLDSKWEAVRNAGEACRVPLARYQKLIDTPLFNDFTGFDPAAMIPNLLAYLKIAKLYNAIQLMEAREGKWEESVERLLRHLEASKRAAKGSRILIVNLIAKAVVNYNLEALTAILNHPGCPERVYRQVLDGMPPLMYEEYGSRTAFMVEYMMGASVITDLDNQIAKESGYRWFKFLPSSVFLQKNRTLNYFYDYYSAVIAYDEQEPYLWKGNPIKEKNVDLVTGNFFWWVRNPVGKIIFSIMVPKIWKATVKGYRLRAYYEQVRILAELRLKIKPGEEVGEVLKRLESYKSHDPFSGKPYLWNREKQLLYSVGLDGEDNGGKHNPGTFEGVDFAIPAVIKKTAEK